MWEQYEKSMDAWIHRIRTSRIKSSGCPLFLPWQNPTNLEASNFLTKKSCLSRYCTHFNSLLLDLLYDIYMCRSGIAHRKKVKLVLAKLTKHNPVLCASTAYKLKYFFFDYDIHYDLNRYTWVDIRLGPHISDHKIKSGGHHTIKYNTI